MSGAQAIVIEDLWRLADAEAPDLFQAILALVAQAEPPPDEPVPADLITIQALQASLAEAARQRSRKQRQALAHEAWKRYLAQAESRIAPQMKLADLIVALYEKRTGAARHALLTIARDAPLVFGIWGGLKRVYKRAEADLDAEVFGALAVRFDTALAPTGLEASARTVKHGTLVYLRTRTSRFLRQLGKAVPALYPQFVVEVLRSYPLGTLPHGGGAQIASGVQHQFAKKWGAPVGLAKEKQFRVPYLEAWQRSPDPLMLLLETCKADLAASFAILGLRELFPDALRKVTPEWLARLAFRPLASAHDFLIETLEGSPAYHQGKLRQLGLHEAVLKLLLSPSAKARKYAIEYARANASDLTNQRLVDLLAASREFHDTAQFIVALLMARPPRQIGVAILGRLTAFTATYRWARSALDTEFERGELGEPFLIEMLLAPRVSEASSVWAQGYLDAKYRPEELPIAFWIRILDDARLADASYRVPPFVMERLTKLKVETAPGEWVLDALARHDIGAGVAEWLKKGEALPAGIDLERIKGLVFDASRRGVAFALLGNRELVSPRDVGLGWLLALARRADPQLHEWAHRYLLQHMRPENFADGSESAKAGIARLFALATGPKEPEAVRAFAQTYLRCHHPKIGRDQPESRQLGLKPLIPRDAYTEERIWPALFDQRGDVRRFAVTVTRAELRRWGAQGRVYELAESSAKEVRNVAFDALSQAGEPGADPDFALLPGELDAVQIFSMTESRARASRDLAIELIRKHYALIGGAMRLGWLMQSADREVRMLAVRLLWEKHRPRAIPAGWKPPHGVIDDAGPFTDADALRGLLRRLLFTVPPPRSMEALEQARAKKVPSSVAKRNLVEIVRDLAVEDAAFAKLVAPVLAEFTGSVAKGEWQACLAALMTLRRVHGIALPEASA